MSEFPKFLIAFGIRTNRAEAFAFYHEAFGAVKTSEEGSPEDLAHHLVYMDLNGLSVLLGPDDNEIIVSNTTYCCVTFDKEEELRKAYDILIQGGQNFHIDSYSFTPLGGGGTDKYGINWWLTL